MKIDLALAQVQCAEFCLACAGLQESSLEVGQGGRWDYSHPSPVRTLSLLNACFASFASTLLLACVLSLVEKCSLKEHLCSCKGEFS